LHGRVIEFDEHAGFGTVVSSEDGREYFFHCTQIADGSRHVGVGAAVEFEIAPGLPGRWEATAIRPQTAHRGADPG
jgi:CspA family cold shock protein